MSCWQFTQLKLNVVKSIYALIRLTVYVYILCVCVCVCAHAHACTIVGIVLLDLLLKFNVLSVLTT